MYQTRWWVVILHTMFLSIWYVNKKCSPSVCLNAISTSFSCCKGSKHCICAHVYIHINIPFCKIYYQDDVLIICRTHNQSKSWTLNLARKIMKPMYTVSYKRFFSPFNCFPVAISALADLLDLMVQRILLTKNLFLVDVSSMFLSVSMIYDKLLLTGLAFSKKNHHLPNFKNFEILRSVHMK